MRSIARFVCLAALCVAASAFAQLEPGAIAVYRVGDGITALSSAATPVFLDVVDAAGSPLATIPMPIAVNGGNGRLTASGTATSEGLLNLSADCALLTLTGYDADLGTVGVASTPSSQVARVVGVVDASGNVDTTTRLGDAANASNVRSAVTTNGTEFWVTGGVGGVLYALRGATASVQVANSPANLRAVGIAAGQLYVSTASGAALRIGSVGSGLPTTAGQVVTGLPGIPTTGSPFAFALLDLDAAEPGPDVLYVADDAGGTITKYSLLAGTWSASGTIAVAGTYRGLAARVTADGVELVATRGGSELVRLVDASGPGGTLTGTPDVIASAAPNTAFRGVAFTPGTPCPEPSASGAALAACVALARRRRAARFRLGAR